MSGLEIKEYVTSENDYCIVTAKEWWFNGELVRRDVSVTVKKFPELFGVTN